MLYIASVIGSTGKHEQLTVQADNPDTFVSQYQGKGFTVTKVAPLETSESHVIEITRAHSFEHGQRVAEYFKKHDIPVSVVYKPSEFHLREWTINTDAEHMIAAQLAYERDMNVSALVVPPSPM